MRNLEASLINSGCKSNKSSSVSSEFDDELDDGLVDEHVVDDCDEGKVEGDDEESLNSFFFFIKFI